MGMLDPMDDPRTMGLLSLGMGLLGSRGSFGDALSQAGPQALQTMRQMGQDKARRQQMEQAQRLQDLQMQQAQMAMCSSRRSSSGKPNRSAHAAATSTASIPAQARRCLSIPRLPCVRG